MNPALFRLVYSYSGDSVEERDPVGVHQGVGDVQEGNPFWAKHSGGCVAAKAHDKDGIAVVTANGVTQCAPVGKAAGGGDLEHAHGIYGGFCVDSVVRSAVSAMSVLCQWCR
jgi:hypothetical protein